MELLYYVNENDEVLNSISRDLAHSQQLLHRTGMVFLVTTENKVLITTRNPERPTYPSTYDASVSFHVTYGETYEAAAKREIFEEIGIQAPITFLGKFQHQDPPEHQIVAVFLSVSDDTPVIDPSEFSDYCFRSVSEVEDLIRNERITPWLRDGWPFLNDYMKEVL
jgi:isopentenyl-diphosphate delta-isomerase